MKKQFVAIVIALAIAIACSLHQYPVEAQVSPLSPCPPSSPLPGPPGSWSPPVPDGDTTSRCLSPSSARRRAQDGRYLPAKRPGESKYRR